MAFLEKARETGKLIVPSKLGEIPEEAYTMELTKLSLSGEWAGRERAALGAILFEEDHAPLGTAALGGARARLGGLGRAGQ